MIHAWRIITTNSDPHASKDEQNYVRTGKLGKIQIRTNLANLSDSKNKKQNMVRNMRKKRGSLLDRLGGVWDKLGDRNPGLVEES